MEPELRELIFELSDTDTPKVCIAVTDDSQRWRILDRVRQELESQGVTSVAIHLSPDKTDLVEVVREKTRDVRGSICIVEGFEHLAGRMLNGLLTNLNFRRDILFELSTPLLLLVSERVLTLLIERAPDFWSRRTATYYFVQPAVREILTRLFREQGPLKAPASGVSAALQRVLGAEGEFNRVVHTLPHGGRAVGERAVNEIRGGVRGLIEECNRSRRTQVALALWTLTRLDEELQQVVARIPSAARAWYSYLYEDRNEILLEMSERAVGILEKYLGHVEDRLQKKQRISLRRLFHSDAARRVRLWAQRVSRYYEQLGPDAISLEDVREEGDEVDTTHGERRATGRARVERQTWVAGPDIDAELRARAARQLQSWLEAPQEGRRPSLLSDEEADLLLMLYHESTDLEYLAQRLEQPIKEVEARVESLRSKVHLLLGLSL